jgi:hypothetical protein
VLASWELAAATFDELGVEDPVKILVLGFALEIIECIPAT